MTPYYENADVGSQRSRRLVVISYHFPPDRAVGAKRWEKFAHFAAERGWGLDVFMRGDLSADDAAKAARSLPSGVRVYAVPIPSLRVERLENALWRVVKGRPHRAGVSASKHDAPTASPVPSPVATPRPTSIPRESVRWQLQTPRGWMRAYWAALDFRRVGAWGDNVLEAVAPVFDSSIHRAVVTSGPPFMSHDVGRRISQRYRIPFVMDMRDPWSHVERLPEGIASPEWIRLATRHEAACVARASLVVVNTEIAHRQMTATYPLRARDIMTITNGSDDDQLPEAPAQDRFVVAHAGTVYLDRDPRSLFLAAAQVIRANSLTPEQFGLEFIGELHAVGGFPIEAVARDAGISDYVHTGPSRPHSEALKFMASATMLVTMSGSNMAAIPAKTFECIRFPAWLLALSAPGSATAELLNGTDADVAAPGDTAGIAEILDRRYREHRDGVQPQPVARDPRFSRRYQAELLFDAIEARVPDV